MCISEDSCSESDARIKPLPSKPGLRMNENTPVVGFHARCTTCFTRLILIKTGPKQTVYFCPSCRHNVPLHKREREPRFDDAQPSP